MAAIDESPHSDGDAPEEPKKRRPPVVAVGILVVVLVLLVLPGYSTLQPAYYERYSDLSDRMDQWRESTHARMSCGDCHVDPGPAGLLTFAARSIPAFYSQLLFGPKHTNLLQPPGTRACQKCHTGFRQVSPDGDVLIPHGAHVDILKIDCVVCHEKLVHAPNEEGINRPKMAGCLARCHDGKQASAKCVDCHTRKQAPDTHSLPDWLKTHSQVATNDECGRCHAWSPDYCAECHGRKPQSHTGNWKKEHKTRAARDSKGCLVCHAEKFCKTCH